MDTTKQMQQDAAAAEAHAARIVGEIALAEGFMAAGMSETPALLMARALYGTEYV